MAEKKTFKLKKVAATRESRQRHRKALAAIEKEKAEILARGREVFADHASVHARAKRS
ncbi:MAG TPA: hypothetical protein VHZ24_12275 [Pirellulales bacterium]|jgi:hypothetical protein|nr:hypothetical protein [Pirellulales bacterium]